MYSWRSSSGMASDTSSSEDSQQNFAVRRTSREMSMSHPHESERTCAGSRPLCENSMRLCASLESRVRSSFHSTSTPSPGAPHGHSSRITATSTLRSYLMGLGAMTIFDAVQHANRSPRPFVWTWPAWPMSFALRKLRDVKRTGRSCRFSVRFSSDLDQSITEDLRFLTSSVLRKSLTSIWWAARVSIPAPWDPIMGIYSGSLKFVDAVQ